MLTTASPSQRVPPLVRTETLKSLAAGITDFKVTDKPGCVLRSLAVSKRTTDKVVRRAFCAPPPLMGNALTRDAPRTTRRPTRRQTTAPRRRRLSRFFLVRTTASGQEVRVDVDCTPVTADDDEDMEEEEGEARGGMAVHRCLGHGSVYPIVRDLPRAPQSCGVWPRRGAAEGRGRALGRVWPRGAQGAT